MNDPVAVDLLVAGGLVVTLDAARRVLADGAVAVRGSRIVEVGRTPDLRARYSADRVIDASDLVMMPGLVDAHVHITAEHLARSVAPDDAGPRWTMEWAVPLYAATTPEEEHAGALLSCLEMIKNGTTTFGEGGTARDLAASADAVTQAGIRGTLGLWTWDRRPEPAALHQTADEALARTDDAIRRFHGAADGRVRVAAACINPVFCTPELACGLKRLADAHGVTFAYHHGNTRQNVDAYVAAHGRRPLLEWADLGLLAANVRTTHMVHLDDAELRALVASGASVAHCPQTALRLGYGATAAGRFPEMLAAGVTVALGTDGVNSSDNQDMFKAMQLAAGLFKDAREDATLIAAETAIEMATLAGARALGLERQVGSLEAGKQADLILLSRRAPELTPLLDVANTLVYATDGRNVDTVIVGGRVLMERRRVATIDEDALYARVREIAPRLIERAGLHPRPRWPIL
ncbi:MAG: amidohydrolase family protein [Candidatus Rokuibacteriota bacterium]